MTASARAVALTVRDVIVETPDARSIVFEHPETRWSYLPGQFLTLRIPGPDETSFARCYSLASAPGVDSFLKVTVKRVDGGYASNWICDELKPGHTIEVLPPAGTFTPTRCADGLLLFAGGSGITPMMSIIKSVLVQVRGSVVLIYANRDEASVIFAEELRDLACGAPDRLQVIHLLESVQGRLSRAQLAALARPYAASQTNFICGPAPFMSSVVEALHDNGVARERIVVEKFRSLDGDPFAAPSAPVHAGQGPASTAVVTIDGVTHELRWPENTSLLDVMLDAGLDAPYSCREGACSACACRVQSGQVEMLRNDVLEDEDLAEGLVLGCQAVPRSDRVELTYDD